jgi:hypothetical protein
MVSNWRILAIFLPVIVSAFAGTSAFAQMSDEAQRAMIAGQTDLPQNWWRPLIQARKALEVIHDDENSEAPVYGGVQTAGFGFAGSQ